MLKAEVFCDGLDVSAEGELNGYLSCNKITKEQIVSVNYTPCLLSGQIIQDRILLVVDVEGKED